MPEKARLIVDTNIAFSAGPDSPLSPSPKNCRDILSYIEKHGFIVSVSPELRQEWNKHQKSYFIAWRTRMMGRKQIEILPDVINDALRRKVLSCAKNEGEQIAILKDCHLIEAAIVTERRIVSCEVKVRRHFASACEKVAEIRRIMWVNPDSDEEGPQEWIREGAPEEVRRYLENYPL